MVDILNPTVWQEADASNVSGTQPSWPEGMPGRDVNNAARAMQGALKRFADQICATRTTAGTSTAFTVAYTQAPEALYAGQRFTVIAHVACGNTPSLNVNSLGAKTIKKIIAGVVTDLAANDFGVNAVLDLVYSVALNCFIWLNPSVSSSSVVDASQTVKGIIEIATRAETQAGTDTIRALTPDDLGSVLYKGAGVAGGTSISLADGGFFEITGSGFSCTSIVFTTTSALGRRALLKFASAGGILVHGASLILPTAGNITVASGDTCEVILESSGVYRVVNYLRATGLALVDAPATAISFNRQTASYTLVASDAGKVVEMNVASANTWTVPPNGTVPMALNTEVHGAQYGVGQTTITPGVGVTLRARGGKLKSEAQYAGWTVKKVATDEWYVWGALTT